MNAVRCLARVILRSDASVHIAFRDVRSIHATAKNLMELFSDPIEFIENTSHSYKDTAFEINRNRADLEDVLGLTLASVNSDKQVVCDFPELFQCIFSRVTDEKEKSANLSMKEFQFETILSDEKAYLLRYYLEFTSSLHSGITIKKNIKLRNEVQFEIIREALNIYFEEELPKASGVIDLACQISSVKADKVFEKDKDLIPIEEYAKMIERSEQTVRLYIKQGLLKTAVRDSKRGKFYINKNELPEKWDRRAGRKRRKKPGEEAYKIKPSSSAAEIEEHILRKKLFTAAVAPYIRTYEEMKYYTSHGYHEVCWDGKPALIIDVNPDYVSSVTKKRNRDLMMAGSAPVVPDRNKEQYEFHIHHVGQLPDSPFAIIPEYDHNSKAFSAVFHQGPPPENLHGPEFALQKKLFWKNYLNAYDAARNYSLIPHLNPSNKKKD